MSNKIGHNKIQLILLLIFIFQARSYGQISPGDLTSAHANLEGMSKCVNCHVLRENVTDEKCLDCHTEIKSLVNANSGYHVSVEVENKQCFECHNEHHGRNFQIIRFEKDSFDHQLTGYQLDGKHAEVECIDCHKNEFIKEKISQKTQGESYLGLQQECLSCHTDYHQESLGANCFECHSFQAFKPAEKFNHDNANFRLVGAHKNADCVKCHKIDEVNGQKFQHFKNVVANNCTDCHTDVHNGKQGNDCLKCHNQVSFNKISDLQSFDHSTTNFPLIGLHQKVDCDKCHEASYTQDIAYQKCTDCHDDFHRGQLTSNRKTTECNSCHNEYGFSPSQYTIERHNQSSFVLDESHLATPCIFCHLKEDQWEFKQIGKKCVDCHEDIHNGIIEKKFYPKKNCESCHSVSSWSEVEFDHKLTEFELEGEHQNQNCRACHFNLDNSQQFNVLDRKCEQCHNDVHFGQFETKENNNCELCHTFTNWLPERFEHDSTRFKLDGGHENVDCFKCHENVSVDENSYINYSFEDIKCVLCHTP
ncbi:MAG: hypothetical protein PF541_09500 [Prolixibacteraceae bacterium]|jgi:hypothetical protein|nr:hypothetical protein [Prolixibacteraceae bacterium]